MRIEGERNPNGQAREIMTALSSLVGETHVASDPATRHEFGKDWLKDFTPAPLCVVFPGSLAEVIAIVRYAHDNRVAIVPSGGRTGLSGGAAATNGEVVVSLNRLNRILSIDTSERLLTCEAGTVTAAVQKAAQDKGLYFPVHFSSTGSSQIGGNIATNAGGVRVVRWGNMRRWVAGLTAVVPPGEIITCSAQLIKDQTGYNLKEIFIGSEGTLGIITEATLHLALPPPPSTRLLVSSPSLPSLQEVFAKCRATLPPLSLFEYLDATSVSILAEIGGLTMPLSHLSGHYALIDIDDVENLRPSPEIEEFFGRLLEEGLLVDCVISNSTKQDDDLIALRERLPEILSSHCTVHKNDISLPLPYLSDFVGELKHLVAAMEPTFDLAIFGHLGDGNLHLNFICPSELASKDFFSRCHRLDHQIFSLIGKYAGSVSAEHGVGLLKRDFLNYSRSSREIEIFRGIKRAFDPHGIMNPGKLVTDG